MEMPVEIGPKVSRILLQPFIHNLKEALRIGAAKFMERPYLIGCFRFLHCLCSLF